MSAWKKSVTFVGVLAIGLISAVPISAEDASATKFRNVTALDMALWMPDALPNARLRYAEESPVQFGDLRLPSGLPPPDGYPVIIFVHGGGWLADWTKDYGERFVEALTEAGFATWDLEFRRMGNEGGGYPGTFLDVAAGADHLRTLAVRYPLDLSRVVAVGHSSGGISPCGWPVARICHFPARCARTNQFRWPALSHSRVSTTWHVRWRSATAPTH